MASSPSFSAFSAPQPMRPHSHAHAHAHPHPHHSCQYHSQASPSSIPLQHRASLSPSPHASSGLHAHPPSSHPSGYVLYKGHSHSALSTPAAHAITLSSSPSAHFHPSTPSPSYSYQTPAYPSPSFSALPPPSVPHVEAPRYLHLSPATATTSSTLRSTASHFAVVPIAPTWRGDEAPESSQRPRSVTHRSLAREAEVAERERERLSGSGDGREEEAEARKRGPKVPVAHSHKRKATDGGQRCSSPPPPPPPPSPPLLPPSRPAKVQRKSKKRRPSLHISTLVQSLPSPAFPSSPASSSASSASSPSPSVISSQPVGFLSPTSSAGSLSSALLVFACPSCPRRFSRNSNLTRHKRIHSNERRFHCPHCSKGFMEKHHLTAHARTHTGEKPYKCPQCPRQFTDRSNCSRHIRTHGLSPVDTEDDSEEEPSMEGEGGVRRVRQLKVKAERSSGLAGQGSGAEGDAAGKVEEEEAEKALQPSPMLSPQAMSVPPPAESPYPHMSSGRAGSLEAFTLQSLQSPLLGLSSGPHSPSERRSSYSSNFSLSPAFTSSSPVLHHLLSASHDLLSPPLPARASPSLPSMTPLMQPHSISEGQSSSGEAVGLGGGVGGSVDEGLSASSISSTLAGLSSRSSPSSSTSASDASLSSAAAASASPDSPASTAGAAGDRLVDALVEASPRAHSAATSLLTAASTAQHQQTQTRSSRRAELSSDPKALHELSDGSGEALTSSPRTAHDGDGSDSRPSTSKTATDQLHALFHKALKERHQGVQQQQQQISSPS